PCGAVLTCGRLQIRGIGAGSWSRLGHREAARDLAARERAEPLLAHGRRCGSEEQIHVPLVGRIAVEAGRPDRRSPHLAEERAHTHDAEAEAALLLRQVRNEETFGL